MIARICNQCGEVIEEGAEFWSGELSRQNVNTPPEEPEDLVMQVDFHIDHVPHPEVEAAQGPGKNK